MRILSWNLGHQTKLKPIAPDFGAIIANLNPALLFLNEYVHDEKVRAPMLAALAAAGLGHVVVSKQIERTTTTANGRKKPNNQVLAASRIPLKLGDLRGPATAGRGGETNFLHIQPEGFSFEAVGLRVPWLENEASRRDYWQAFETIAGQVADRRILFIGDFNADPDDRSRVGGSTLARLAAAGWHLPSPQGQWSFHSGTRIDHAVSSRHLPLISAAYVAELNERMLAGSDDRAVSDHAALVVEVLDV
jgi:hypothetical protein